MHVYPSRDTEMCFLLRSGYEFILLSFLPLKMGEQKPFTAFACLFNSRVSSTESEMNEWKSTEEISILSEKSEQDRRKE
jgi:hypothetical protein